MADGPPSLFVPVATPPRLLRPLRPPTRPSGGNGCRPALRSPVVGESRSGITSAGRPRRSATDAGRPRRSVADARGCSAVVHQKKNGAAHSGP